MPTKLNVGLSRKVGEANYGSRGASVDIEMELDSSVIGEPEKLKERIRQLFGLVRNSLAEELNGGNGHAHAPPQDNAKPNGTASRNGNDNGATRSNVRQAGNPRPATQSQIKAIYAIAKSQRLNLDAYLAERFGIKQPEDLDIKGASEVIDRLKADTNEGRR